MQADIQERQAQEPPKLGRLKFTPQPTQVLATDDVKGSLRTLRTVPVIAKDRFKSLQKRGLIHVCIWQPDVLRLIAQALCFTMSRKSVKCTCLSQVTVKQHRIKPSKRRVKRFEKKATQETHERSQHEIKELKQRRQHVARMDK